MDPQFLDRKEAINNLFNQFQISKNMYSIFLDNILGTITSLSDQVDLLKEAIETYCELYENGELDQEVAYKYFSLLVGRNSEKE